MRFSACSADWEEIGEYLVQVNAHAGLEMQGTGHSFTPRSVKLLRPARRFAGLAEGCGCDQAVRLRGAAGNVREPTVLLRDAHAFWHQFRGRTCTTSCTARAAVEEPTRKWSRSEEAQTHWGEMYLVK
jgi:hypothetical protein